MKLFFLSLITSSLFGALPPLSQSLKETQALLADPRFYHSLGSAESIREIIRTESGFLVLTQHYALPVEVVHSPKDSKMVGPIPFELKFSDPIDLRKSAAPS